MDCACATLRYAAPELRSGEREHVTKNPQQRHVGWYVNVARLTIDIQCDHMRTPDSRSPVHSQKTWCGIDPSCLPLGTSQYALNIINASARLPAEAISLFAMRVG
jgi:hypothetical protein